MTHAAKDLLTEYVGLLPQMRIVPNRRREFDETCQRLVRNWRAGRYEGVPEETGIPAPFIMASFEREASSNFLLSPAQGDRWDRESVNVPAHRGPFASWREAALDAYHLNKLDQVGAEHWTWALACFYGELFNGFGYRDWHHMRSPYLWGGTTLQQVGKYVSDGSFDPRHFDQQLGVVPMMMVVCEIEPSLRLPGLWPFTEQTAPVAAPPLAAPASSPVAAFDVKAIQRALNAKGYGPLKVDGSFGKFTSGAFKAFEKDQQLESDGLLDEVSVEELLTAA